MFYRTDADRGWQPDLDHLRSLVSPRTKALVVIDPNNPTGATYPAETRRALLEIAETHNVPLLADEVYADLVFALPTPPPGDPSGPPGPVCVGVMDFGGSNDERDRAEVRRTLAEGNPVLAGRVRRQFEALNALLPASDAAPDHVRQETP